MHRAVGLVQGLLTRSGLCMKPQLGRCCMCLAAILWALLLQIPAAAAGCTQELQAAHTQLVALLSCWYCCRWDNLHDPVHIVMVGKYTVLSDAYLSVLKALQHACMAAGMKLKLTWVEAQYLEPEAKEEQAEKFEESWKQVRACAGAGRAFWRAACCLGVLSLLTVSSWYGLVGSAVCEIANGSTVNVRGYCACVA